MWERTGRLAIKYRLSLLVLLCLSTAFMAWHTSKVELSYEFSRAIPIDNPKYLEYQAFKEKFGEDGNLMVIGMQTNRMSEATFFNDFVNLTDALRNIEHVEDVLSLNSAVNLVKND